MPMRAHACVCALICVRAPVCMPLRMCVDLRVQARMNPCLCMCMCLHSCLCAPWVQEGDLLVAQVRGEMEAMRGQYQGMVAELQAKLSWWGPGDSTRPDAHACTHEQTSWT